jgi:hypothetical protein
MVTLTADPTPTPNPTNNNNHRGRPHPLHAPAAPPLDAFRASPNSPIIVTPNPMATSQRCGPSLSPDPRQHVPINGTTLFPFETDTFAGTVAIDLRNLPTTRPEIFNDGKRRLFHVVIQGRFRRRVAASSFCIGQEFVKPGNAPPWIGELVLSAAARSFSASTHVDARGKLPYFMNPVLAACQLANVSRAGEEPQDPWEAQEDLRLWAPELVVDGGEAGSATTDQRPMPSEQRRRWCDCSQNLAQRNFEPREDLVWTFHVYQHLIDFASYRLNVGLKGFFDIDLAPTLDCQPLQLTLKDVDAKEYAMSWLVWHERLLYPEGGDEGGAKSLRRSASMSALRGAARVGGGLFSSPSAARRKKEGEEAKKGVVVAMSARSSPNLLGAGVVAEEDEGP